MNWISGLEFRDWLPCWGLAGVILFGLLLYVWEARARGVFDPPPSPPPPTYDLLEELRKPPRWLRSPLQRVKWLRRMQAIQDHEKRLVESPKQIAAILKTADGAQQAITVPYPPPPDWRTAVMEDLLIHQPHDPEEILAPPRHREYRYRHTEDGVAIYEERVERPKTPKERKAGPCERLFIDKFMRGEVDIKGEIQPGAPGYYQQEYSKNERVGMILYGEQKRRAMEEPTFKPVKAPPMYCPDCRFVQCVIFDDDGVPVLEEAHSGGCPRAEHIGKRVPLEKFA